jgi:hypothetical protein
MCMCELMASASFTIRSTLECERLTTITMLSGALIANDSSRNSSTSRPTGLEATADARVFIAPKQIVADEIARIVDLPKSTGPRRAIADDSDYGAKS